MPTSWRKLQEIIAVIRIKRNGLLGGRAANRRATDRCVYGSFEYRKVIVWKARQSWPAFLARFASANQPLGLKTSSNDRAAEKGPCTQRSRSSKSELKLLPQFEQKASENGTEKNNTAIWLPVIGRRRHFAVALIKMHSTTS